MRQPTVKHLDRVVFVILGLLALASGLSPKAIIFAVPAAILWTAKLVIAGRRVGRLPLAAPMLALLISTAIVSCFAYDPIASWTRVRMFGAMLVAVIIGETCTSLSRVRILSLTLCFSALVAVGWAAWQYSFGVGVKFRSLSPALVSAGVAPSDIVLKADGIRTRTPKAWEKTIHAADPSNTIKLQLLRPLDGERFTVALPVQELARAGLDRESGVVRGRPCRVYGFYQHFVPFSVLLTLIAVLVWGLAITAQGRARWIFAAMFLAIAACLAATVTRSAMIVLLGTCLVLLWRAAGWKLRVAALATAAALLVAGSLWIQHTRGLGWLAPGDPGTQYRLVIWQDGLRLIAQHPLVGVGFDNVVRHPEHWKIRAFELFPLKSHFHSTPIEYGVDGGLLTLATWFWLLGSYCMLLLRLTDIPDASAFARGLALGLLGSLVAFFAMSLIHYTGGDSDVMTVFWFTMGLAIALHQIARNSQTPVVTATPPSNAMGASAS